MSEPLFVLLLLICGATVLWAIHRPDGLYLYPTLAALTIVGWVAPQLMILLDYPDLPQGALPLTMAMIVLSFAALLLGWRRGAAALPALPRLTFDTSRLLWGAIGFSLFGAWFRLAIRDLPAELLEMGQWSGPQTIYVFFARTQVLALALAWLIYLRNQSWLALAVVVFNFLFFADQIFIGGRRGTIVEVGIILLAGLWFARRWSPPRAALVAAALGLTILFNVIGEYRAATSARTVHTDRISLAEAWENIKQIDFLASFQRTIEERNPRMMELHNATLVIGATQERLVFQGLATYWNRLVFAYVPGQIVGFDVKEALMFATADPMLEVYGVYKHPGTTTTGFADAFRSFWLFGAMVFFGFAWLMRLCWERATQGQLLFQFLYLILMKDALHAVTHSTAWFVSFWLYLVIFTAPLFWFAYRARPVVAVPVQKKASINRPPRRLATAGLRLRRSQAAFPPR